MDIYKKINSLFTNSLILIIKQDEKINQIIEEYKNFMKINPQANIGQGQVRTLKRLNSGHSTRSSRSRARKKGKTTNFLNNTFNIIEEEFKNQIKSEKNKFKYRTILLKYFGYKYVQNIFKVFDDTYIVLDEWIIDSVKKQNVVLNEFIEYLKSTLTRFVNYITLSDFEFDSFDIYEKYKLKIEDYFNYNKEEEDEKIEMKKFNYSSVDLYKLYHAIKEYSSDSVDYLAKTNLVKEILIKKYFLDTPSNIENKAINQKIKELTYENYDYFFNLFEEHEGKYININELFTTLFIIGSNTINNDKWKEIVTENILNKEDFMKINFGFENDIYLSKSINEEEEKQINEKGEDYTKADFVKEIIFDINQIEGKIDMRKLEKLFKIINGEIIKEKKDHDNLSYKSFEDVDFNHSEGKEHISLNKDDFHDFEHHHFDLKDNLNDGNQKDKNEINENEENENNNINNNLINNIIREDDEDEYNEEEEEENEGEKKIKKIQKVKLSENKSLIFNLVFGFVK